MTALVWFRNDLRTADNPALFDACESAAGEPVVGVYLVCASQFELHGEGPARLGFVRETLDVLRADLARLGIPLWIGSAPTFADVPDVLMRIAANCDARTLYFNAEYPFNEARRDRRVSRACAASGIDCQIRHGDVILPPGMVLKDDRTPYSVFTPFKRRWQAQASRDELTPLPAPKPLPKSSMLDAPDAAEALAELPATPSAADWPAGEAEAHRRLSHFTAALIGDYEHDRDFPGKHGTSRLSPYLAVGAISVRTCYDLANRAASNPGVDTWLSELIWREFYRHVIALYPHVSKGHSFRKEMDALQWRDDPEALDAWKAGQTGYPLVDAGMRQLLATGFMHNRLRMVTAMFLTKHLLIDWREGERHFMLHLRDADFASNNGGWQWSASTGTDAAPYFRIFNPESQAKKFDPDNGFVRTFVPELGDGQALTSYPAPIVDHRAARERALAFFKRR